MHPQRIKKITEALFSQSASVIKKDILKDVSIDELIELSSHSHGRLAFRAAWALEHVLLSDDKEILMHYAHDIIRTYDESNNWSALRSISKMVIALMDKDEFTNSLSEEDTESLLNKTFLILENTDCPVAVRCNMYDILVYLIPIHYWIRQELKKRIEFDLEKNKMPALVSRTKKVFKQLERIPNP